MTDTELLEVVHRCQEGKAKKFVGAGLVILNYDWWKEMLYKEGKFKPVPNEEDMEGAETDGNI